MGRLLLASIWLLINKWKLLIKLNFRKFNIKIVKVKFSFSILICVLKIGIKEGSRGLSIEAEKQAGNLR